MANYKNIAEPSPFLVNVKRSCIMLAREKCIRKLMETPKRENSFFAHLNEDVRKKIYGHFTLFPFKDCIETSGLFLSCRQEKLEIEQEAVRTFWLYLREMEPTLGTLDRGFGYFDFLNTHVFGVRQSPPLLPSINNKLDLAGVKSLTVIVDT
ncbi:hypothetical protein BS50DRAFT_39013 [Corynespora cassiicola Philippines]|uniref:Uncharacterized protein n=1 Tax=Corynespora cassiicola Philippines TaxID=1448308 RepID=A0A2T2PCK5_CORCC|nr:hypothetical protein BS50DRAFT_39013 [Corynespora cassiicola Philippines]